MKENRRDFIKKVGLASLGASMIPFGNENEVIAQEKDKKKPAKKDPNKINMGFIGVGSRGEEHVRNALLMDGVELTAICDIDPEAIKNTNGIIEKAGRKKPEAYSGSEFAYEKMVKRGDLDVVIIATPWEWHTMMAVASMKNVAYSGVEVSAANTLEECWDLVNTHEQTGNHVMILENVCYRRDVMAILNMVRTNVLGELMHCRCGYEHDLREVKFNDGKQYAGGGVEFGEKAFAEARWRALHSIRRNGDLYPTHGTGPIGTYLDINRGNRFLTLSSMATKTRGLHEHIVKLGGQNHPNAKIHFNLGDIVTSMIKCANGETVIVTHDTNLPRPYSLGFRVQGTKGLWYNDGNTVYVEGQSKPHQWDNSKQWFEKYDHSLWKITEEKAKGAGHGGMDFVLMYDLIESVKSKQPPPLDAYDAAAWSSISPLSEMSVAKGGTPVDFPDFTRGQWIKRKPYFALDEKFPISPERMI